jgi:signal transduction histidine kinase
LWEPFYQTLAALNRFEMDHLQEPVLSAGRIEEFMFLNKSILDLTNRTRAAFLDQKQFIENASHEMQTPLAITQSKLELLIADQHLTEQQAEIIQTLLHSTQRLARLNKTLLLLSKIENQQFPQKERIVLRPLLDEILTNFEEQQATHHLTLEITEQNPTSLYADKTLVDLLLTNLVKNAFFHNRENGAIHIDMNQHHFSIRNTSSSPAIPTAHLYQRFYKQSTTTKDSWGLGLAMAKKICDINDWRISYTHEGDEHLFVITF